MLKVGILGANGYAGAELVRLLARHPYAKVVSLAARSVQDVPFSKVYPQFAKPQHAQHCSDKDDPTQLCFEAMPSSPAQWREQGIQLVFSALPHGVFAQYAAQYLQAQLKVIDLSADFRLKTTQDYTDFYGMQHPAPQLLAGAVYGLCDWTSPADYSDTALIANPGCYTTAALLAALPAVQAGWANPEQPLVISATSGVTGAGRQPRDTTHFVSCGNGVRAYKIGQCHPHRAELMQMLRQVAHKAGCQAPQVVFTPHLAPCARGISAAVHISLRRQTDQLQAQQLYTQRYQQSAFVRVCQDDQTPGTADVRGSNRTDLQVKVVADGRMLLVIAVLDNLIKGAAGQAIENMNHLYSWPAHTGLSAQAWPCV